MRRRRLELVHSTDGPQALLPSSVLGMLIFVIAEAMLFAGLVSAFMIVRASAPIWPPPGQPRLPIGATALNTAALLASGVAVWLAQRAFRREPPAARRPLLAGIALGAAFVVFQGVEWVRLIGQGLTLTSSTHGGFFYLIVGLHALHAIAAIAALAWAGWLLSRSQLRQTTFAAVQIFWYFVVGLWPILYLRVYW
jgi:heme/copper-type cytochrome/quinol oxidase subunit 3